MADKIDNIPDSYPIPGQKKPLAGSLLASLPFNTDAFAGTTGNWSAAGSDSQGGDMKAVNWPVQATDSGSRGYQFAAPGNPSGN